MRERIGLREEAGQALVIAGMGAFVLAVALALSIDWSYALLQRRIVQNDADKIAVGVGRLLATSVESGAGSTVTFGISHKDACDQALLVRTADRSAAAAGASTLSLTFEGDPGVLATPAVECPTSETAVVPSETTTVYVRIEVRYRPLLASILRQPDVLVAASARAWLSAAPYTLDVTLDDDSRSDYVARARSATAIKWTWPMVLRFDTLADILEDSAPCGPLCDPATASPLLFAQGPARAPGVQFLDLSRRSSHLLADDDDDETEPVEVDQLITEPDDGGVGPTDLARWFEVPFSGVLGLDTTWGDEDVRPDDVRRPPRLGLERYSCVESNAYAWLTRRSCLREDNVPTGNNVQAGGSNNANSDKSNSFRGDWVETFDDLEGQVTPNLVEAMRSFISQEGGTFPFSSEYGKAVVVWIYVWDCGQSFDEERDRWGIRNDDDEDDDEDEEECDTAATDRVHLFTAIPVTFYLGLVTTDAIEGYWGGDFADPGRCETSSSCELVNPLATTAFLVGDEPPVVNDPGDDDGNGDDDEGDDDDNEGPGGPRGRGPFGGDRWWQEWCEDRPQLPWCDNDDDDDD